MMLDGRFEERSDDPHVLARLSLLAGDDVLPEIPVSALEVDTVLTVADVFDPLKEQLDTYGLAHVQFREPPSRDQFRQLGEQLGTLMSETDPTVAPFVEQAVILNLISRFGHGADPTLQPFSSDYLTLHSECSSRPLNDQPRYITLLCLEPGDNPDRAQTVVVPMEAVAAQLPEPILQILMETRYRHCINGPMLARPTTNGLAFSFRDFRAAALDWTTEGKASASEVGAALRLLLHSMYRRDLMSGVCWRRGLMVVIDNCRFFHGRTSGPTMPGNQTRHLIRLRIL
ncbi:TauD/TfdA family dioxygenase [Neorhizobium sp. BETTINA12A]|uniref:TauD/TfdA family dioxygenase n=1 Tax=Neorhizobium sp. BETTINA12A TaxID=2908924 RepID=UPI001FF39656|nr:TauD/TfdA family dioxygenase [Neorhizobium sp. BETTINA12A]MCJ9750402.1 TauD/TfdA family dioxygenase [Neorhizobium sp. BETTINA12A]